ncbi:MAG: asparaginase [Thermoplasmatota archaeon]
MHVRVLRGEFLESEHRLSAAVCDPRGEMWAHVGDPHYVTCLRSSAKPFQAIPLVATGAADRLGLSDAEIAIACGSHNAEPRHREAVRSILRKAGVDESALRCGAHAPYSAKDAAELVQKGEAPTAIYNNCSGKHAGFLAACAANGWPTETYLDRGHPLQKAIVAGLARATGLPPERIGLGTDGCSAPAFFMPLSSFARAFSLLARPDMAAPQDREALARIARAIEANPWYVAGTGRIDTDLMGAAEGRLLSKAGGEAVHAIADKETGRALVLKVEDGASRARDPGIVEALRQLGWVEPRALEVLGDYWRPTLRNWNGLTVGRIEPAFQLAFKGGPVR